MNKNLKQIINGLGIYLGFALIPVGMVGGLSFIIVPNLTIEMLHILLLGSCLSQTCVLWLMFFIAFWDDYKQLKKELLEDG